MDIRRAFGLNLRYQFLLLYTLDPALPAAAAHDAVERGVVGEVLIDTA